MLGWLFDKLKWLLLIAAVGGPFIAFISWQDEQRRHEVMASGVEADAAIEGATRTKGRRGGTTYKVALSWSDAQGTTRTAKDVAVSHGYADRIIRDDKIIADTTRIRYIADSGEEQNVIIAEDEAYQERTDHEMIYVGAVAGLVGLIGSGLIFLVGRRRKEQAQAA